MCALFMWLYVAICVTEWVEIWLGMDWDISNDGFVTVWWCFWVSVRVTECGYPVSQCKNLAGRQVGVGSLSLFQCFWDICWLCNGVLGVF